MSILALVSQAMQTVSTVVATSFPQDRQTSDPCFGLGRTSWTTSTAAVVFRCRSSPPSVWQRGPDLRPGAPAWLLQGQHGAVGVPGLEGLV